jgi:uncharacterized LabA/DUF88 family protein
LIAEGARALGADVADVKPDPGKLVEVLRGLSWDNRSSLLRVYWYDAIVEPGDASYKAMRMAFDVIEATPGLRLRLGHLSVQQPAWQAALKRALRECGVDKEEFAKHFELRPERRQKGVDTLLTLDLVSLAQRGGYDRAILIAGDRDFAEPVRLAQDEGRRVYLWTPREDGLASELRALADEVRVIDANTLGRLLGVHGTEE